MEVSLTKEQAIEIATNAINASAPMGMGRIHFEDKNYTQDEVAKSFGNDDQASFDYYHGRMVKLHFFKSPNGDYIFPSLVDVEYQSWAGKYPTYEDLILSVVPDATFEEIASTTETARRD